MRKALHPLLIFLLTLLFSAGCSCSDKEVILGPMDMWSKAHDYDPSIELIFLADSDEGRAKRVLCSHYREEGCVADSGKRIKVRMVELMTIQYKDNRTACLAALDIGQWYAYNWLFDEVENEPVLESFIQEVYQARKPKTEKDCQF